LLQKKRMALIPDEDFEGEVFTGLFYVPVKYYRALPITTHLLSYHKCHIKCHKHMYLEGGNKKKITDLDPHTCIVYVVCPVRHKNH
jgi:hypothetical protein